MAGNYQRALDLLEEMEREDENLYPLSELDPEDDVVIREQTELDLEGSD